jgi:hypothetical protein
MLNSDYRRLCPVQLPYAGRQHYMHSFDLAKPKMLAGYEDYLEPVMALCEAAGARTGVAHMTVDEKVVKAGMSQRRPRPHVDGCFMTDTGSWGHEPQPRPFPGPAWLHYCNHLPVPRMAVIVASSAVGCRAWRGQFDGHPKNDGDLSHIAEQLGKGEVLPANVGYLLAPDCVHESMLMERDTQRTFLRIALPVGVFQ